MLGRVDAGPGRRAHPHRGRHRRRRWTCSPATSWATPTGRRRRPSPSPTPRAATRARCGSAWRWTGRSTRRWTPSASAGCARRPSCSSSLGHAVEEVDPPWVGGNLLPTFMKLWAVNISGGVVRGAQVTGREPSPELVEPLTWWLYEQGRALNAIDFALAVGELQGWARSIITTLWSSHDVVLLPTLARRPLQIGELDTSSDDPAGAFRLSGQFTPHTALFNVSGQPAVSLPLFQGDDGLPTARAARRARRRARRCCCRWPRSWRRRGRGPTAGRRLRWRSRENRVKLMRAGEAEEGSGAHSGRSGRRGGRRHRAGRPRRQDHAVGDGRPGPAARPVQAVVPPARARAGLAARWCAAPTRAPPCAAATCAAARCPTSRRSPTSSWPTRSRPSAWSSWTRRCPAARGARRRRSTPRRST